SEGTAPLTNAASSLAALVRGAAFQLVARSGTASVLIVGGVLSASGMGKLLGCAVGCSGPGHGRGCLAPGRGPPASTPSSRCWMGSVYPGAAPPDTCCASALKKRGGLRRKRNEPSIRSRLDRSQA